MKLYLHQLHYNLGHLLHQQGDLAGAVVAYQQAIQLEPDFAQAHHSLAVVLTAQGQYEAAIRYYRQVIALQPDAVKAYNNIGCILIQQGQFCEAQQLYQTAIGLQPNWAELYSNLGRALAPEDSVAAAQAYRRAIDLQPDLTSAQYGLAQVLQQAGQPLAAIEVYQQLLHLDATDPLTHNGSLTHSGSLAHSGCGLAHLILGNWEQAFHHFQQALLPQQAQVTAFCDWVDALSPLKADELTLARQACSRFLRNLFQLEATFSRQPQRLQGEQTSGSESEVEHYPLLRRKIRSLPETPSVSAKNPADRESLKHCLAQIYLHLGDMLLRYGGAEQCRQAENYYQQALRLVPSIALYLRLGNCLVRQQRHSAAVMVYHMALTLYPKAGALYQQLGLLLEQQQRWQAAISYYQQALQWAGDGTHEPRTTQEQAASLARLPDEVSAGYTNITPCSTLVWANQSSCRYISLEPKADCWTILDSGIKHEARASNTASFDNSRLNSHQSSGCTGINCKRCLNKISEQFTLTHLGNSVYTCHSPKKQESPPCFVAQLPQAQAWLTPYQTSWMVTNATAVLTADQHLLTDVSREYPGQLPGCNQSVSFNRFQQSASSPELIAGRVAVLAGLSGHNYFHWMVDVLPRLELLRRSGLDAAVDWFWINNPQAAFQQQTLHHLGIPADKILASDQHPHIQAELIVPSFPGYLGWLEPWALRFLRQSFLPLAKPDALCHERIYISRANAAHRRLLNEAAVLDRLDFYGFVSVELESLSLAEQIALFAHAKIILAPHGGGLTNLIFCTPGATVVELFAPNYIRHYYWVISQQLGLRYYFVKGEEFSCSPIQRLMYPSPLMEDIWVEMDALDAALKQIGLQ